MEAEARSQALLMEAEAARGKLKQLEESSAALEGTRVSPGIRGL